MAAPAVRCLARSAPLLIAFLLAACVPSSPDGSVYDAGDDSAAQDGASEVIAPALQSPSEGAVRTPMRVVVEWESGRSEELEYDVYLGVVDPPSALVATISSSEGQAGGESFVLSPETGTRLLPSTQYYWRVVARRADGASAASEVRSFRTDASLVGWWRFTNDLTEPCEASEPAETVCDESGHRNHGIPFGSVRWLPDFGDGALQFDGAEAGVDVPYAPSLLPRSLTIVARARADVAPPVLSTLSLVDKRGGGEGGYQLRLEDQSFPVRLRLIVKHQGTEYYSDSGGVMADALHHLVGAYDQPSGEASVYLDGARTGEVNHGVLAGSTDAAADLRIGGSNFANVMGVNDSWWRGVIDEIAILNRALTAEEVAESWRAVERP